MKYLCALSFLWIAGSPASSASTVGYWRFENAGSPGGDSGPNSIALEPGNFVAVPTVFPAILPGTGVANSQAGDFEVSNTRYLSVADSEAFEFSDFTIEAYIQVEEFGSGANARTIASQLNTGTATTASNAWQFGVTGASSSLGAKRPFLQLSGDGNALISFTPGSNFALVEGKSYYVAATARFTGTGISTVFYLKNLTDGGVLLSAAGGTTATSFPAGIFNSTAKFAIGASYTSGAPSRYFDGLIDEVRLSNTALAAADLLGVLPGEVEQPPAPTGTVTEILNYTSSVSTDNNGPLNLTAELNYDNSRTNAPVMVLMHPFSNATGHFSAYRPNAIRMSEAGFFVISPAMRGRESSDGVRDNGGVEVYDIHDAVEALKLAHPTRINADSISIIGYSGGGGNVMSALTKFPDYFRVGAAYYGMSDYGFDPVNGWYFKGAEGRVTTLNASPGNPTPPSTQLIKDSYHARASNLASKNNPYSEIHLFVNEDETTCPAINVTSYRDNAVAAAASAGEFSNITAHIGLPGVYHDFDNDGVNDANELQYWPHANPSINQEQSGDLWYRARLLAGTIPQPALNAQDQLFVAGYVKTRRFGFWLGDGQNAAGNLSYSLSQATKQFTFTKASVLPVTGKLTVDTSDSTGATIEVRRNGTVIETFTGGGLRVVNEVADGDTITFSTAGAPVSAYVAWRLLKFGAGSLPLTGDLEDFDHDGISNLAEFALHLDPLAGDPASKKPSVALVEETPGGNRLLEFKFRQRKNGTGTTGLDYAAEGVRYTVQTSTDLTPGGWAEGSSHFTLVGSPVDNGDGTETITVRLTGATAGNRFVRLKFTLVP